MNYLPEQIFDLMAESITQSFLPFRSKFTYETDRGYMEEKLKYKADMLRFSKSKLLQIWTDCSKNFEHEKLSKLLIKHINKI